jgi:pimeloyl-ACP methyl ester carboxylesterase
MIETDGGDRGNRPAKDLTMPKLWQLLFLLLFLTAVPRCAASAAADSVQADTKAASKSGPVNGTEPGTAKPAKRRIYVLHSGLHTLFANPNKNIAAEMLREGLLERGIDDRDIVVMDNPFPTASPRDVLPKKCLIMFAESSDPASAVAQAAYLRLHKALEAKGVKAGDNVIWVGHSAGGQMGMTMAYLARNLDKFPKLAKSTRPYNIGMVITLGSPVCSNLLPKEVKLRHYYSPDDDVVSLAANIGRLSLGFLGYPRRVHTFPPNLNGNAKIRVFFGIEHPYWDVDPRVLDCIVSECRPQYQPGWFTRFFNPGPGRMALESVVRFIDQRYNVTVEDLPRPE